MKNNNAFTLVELMIVVCIIGLLAAMVIPIVQKIKAGDGPPQKVYVIGATNGQVLIESTLKGSVTSDGSKSVWTDAEGIVHEHITGPGTFIHVSATPPPQKR